MKIAITGDSAGIGQAFANILRKRGHDIVGLSKRHGHNIRNIPKIVEKILPCDLFINNAQAGYAQTELLYNVWDKWQNQQNKYIWCIGTCMTQSPVSLLVPPHSELAMSQYRNQKIALEDAVTDLRFKSPLPIITVIRPGAVATQPGQVGTWPLCDADVWAELVIDTIIAANEKNMRFDELALLASKHKVPL